MGSWIYRHDIDPFLIQFTETIGIRWYGLAYVLGFIMAYWMLLRLKESGWFPLGTEEIGDLVITVALTGVIGGRLGFVFLYGLEYLAADPLYAFRIWEGGMSIHGGVVGAVIGIVWFGRNKDYSTWKLLDAGALTTPPGLFFGRIANFINGELWGRPTGGDWGVIFPDAPGSEVPRHPSQLYEAVLEGPLLLGLLFFVMRKTDRNGIVASFFLIGYGVLRFLVEFYRAPDPFIGYELFGMTRGQEYSLFFVLIGLIMLWIRRRSVSSTTLEN